MVTETLTKSKIDFRQIDKTEPEWLYNTRKNAWEFYQDAPMPSRVIHLWKYTRPEWFLHQNIEEQMAILPIISEIKDSEMAPLKPQFAAFGCNRGDIVSYTQLGHELKGSGVIFKDLPTAVRDYGDLVQSYLGRLVGFDFGKFEALNMALWNSGLFLYIPPNMSIEGPIYMHRQPNTNYNIPRLLIIAGENSRATIIDEYGGRGNGFNANGAVEIFAEPSSHLHYINPQNLSSSVRSYLTQRAEASRGAEIYSIFASLGSDVSKNNLGTILAGRGAQSRMLGILFGNGKQHFDHHTMHHHKAGDSHSVIDFKVVLKDKALSAYTGLIKIEENTTNCEAYQENRNLLLNKGARAETIPELEILNDQVSCSHGATVGPIDPEMIFYLKSRGISSEDAVRVVVGGFIEPLLNQVPENMRQMMRNLVDFKLVGKYAS